jgi:hypothetical protein
MICFQTLALRMCAGVSAVVVANNDIPIIRREDLTTNCCLPVKTDTAFRSTTWHTLVNYILGFVCDVNKTR